MFLVAFFDLLRRDRQTVTFAHTKYLLFVNLGSKRDNLAGFRIGYQNRKSNENALKCRVVKDNTVRDSNMPRIKF